MTVIVASIFYSSSVYAVSYQSPDPADNSDDTWLEVSGGSSTSLDAPTSTVVIYSNTPNPRIVIKHFNHCTDGSTNYGRDSSMPPILSGSDTSFDLYQGGDPSDLGLAAPTVNNSISSVASGCEGQDYTFTPNLTVMGTPGTGLEGFYVARLNARLTLGNGVNAFKVQVLDSSGNPGGYVSYTNQDNFRFSLQKRPGSAAGQSNIGIKFAMPCNAPATLTSSLSWYDDDYGTGNQFPNLEFRVSSRPRGSSGPYTTFITNTSDWGGEAVNKSIPITLNKGDEYIWEWINVNNSNGIQFTVPFNSIFAEVACVNYNVTPSVTLDSSIVEPGATVTVNPKVHNDGPSVTSPTQWQVSRFTLASGEAVPNSGGGTSPGAPCAGFFKLPPGCTVIASGSDIFNVGDTSLPNVANIIDDLPAGSQICYALSIQPYDLTSTDWRHSPPVCVKIGSKPKVQVWGGDVISRSNIITSTTVKNIAASNHTFGSWGEYGIFSLGTNNGMASGAGLSGSGSLYAGQGAWSALTFANKGGIFGSYGPSSALPARSGVANYFMAKTSSPLASNTLSLSGKTGVLRYDGAADIVINPSNILKNNSVVIVAPNARVRIAGPITYVNGPFVKATEIPQVVIIASSIDIDGSVSNIDAWLVATNGINTCDDVPLAAQLSINICNVPLTINGPVISTSLYLQRTGGSGAGAASGDPAERINLRADAYLWAKTQTGNDGTATTVFSYEAPPRF